MAGRAYGRGSIQRRDGRGYAVTGLTRSTALDAVPDEDGVADELDHAVTHLKS